MTRGWSRLVGAALATMPHDATFAQLLASHPGLASEVALHRHFSPGLLASPEARARWLPPDRAPLPVPAARPGTGAATALRERRLRAAFLAGAVIDALALIPMLVPSMASLLWGFAEQGAPYRFAMGYAASLLLAWTALLLWASRRPLERDFVAPLTMLVIWGLVATELATLHAGGLALARLAPTLVLQAGLLWLLASAYHGWHLGVASPRDPAVA